MDIPQDIDLNLLPGYKRGEYPAHYFSDSIAWSPSGHFFVLLYTAFEISNGNDVGHILWGSFDGKHSKVLGNFIKSGGCLWSPPYVNWVTDESFVLKLQYYDGKKLHLPLVHFNVNGGMSLLPNTDNLPSRPKDVTSQPDCYPISTEKELLAVLSSA